MQISFSTLSFKDGFSQEVTNANCEITVVIISRWLLTYVLFYELQLKGQGEVPSQESNAWDEWQEKCIKCHGSFSSNLKLNLYWNVILAGLIQMNKLNLLKFKGNTFQLTFYYGLFIFSCQIPYSFLSVVSYKISSLFWKIITMFRMQLSTSLGLWRRN